MNLLDRYVSKVEYDNLEDFEKNYRILVPEYFNFGYDVVDEMARISPDQTALVWANPQGDERIYSFAQLKEGSDRAANYLRSLGIGRGDKVMLILKRHFEYWFILVALHKLNAIAIPATHLLTAKDIAYRSNAASIKAIISTGEGEVAHHVMDAMKESPTVEKLVLVRGQGRPGWEDFDTGWAQASPDLVRRAEVETKSSDMMLIYFTSGTTGMPKMVAHAQNYALAHITTAKYWQNNMDGGLHLTIADTGWGKAAWGKIYGQWISGTAVMVYDFDKFVPAEILHVMEKYGVTSFCAPPTMYRFMIREDLSQVDFSKLKYCCTAGEALNPEVHHQWLRATGHHIHEGFGQTETTLTIFSSIYHTPIPGSMGRVSPAYDMDVVDEDGYHCEVGQVGEIVVRTDRYLAPGMFLGYYRDEDRTNAAWHDNLYHTGDTAWQDADGCLWYVSRTDDIIKTSGYRVGPFEVESALMEHPAVLETAITGVPDPIRGQIIKATVVLNKGYVPSDALAKELQDHVKRVTAPYKYPRVVEFIDELPKTISGKIRRVELRNR